MNDREPQGRPPRAGSEAHGSEVRADPAAALDAMLAQVAMLGALVEHAEEQLVFLDADFRVRHVNQACAESWGRRPTEIIGRSLFEVLPQTENRTVFERVRDTGAATRRTEQPLVLRDQPERGVTYWDWSLAPVKDATGAITGLVLIQRDATERVRARRRLEESEARFRHMAEGAPSLIWVTDAAGGLQFANSYCLSFFGVDYEQLKGSGWQPMIHPEDAPAYVGTFLRAVAAHAPYSADARARHCSGEWRWLASHAEPRFTADGEFLGYVGLSNDITARKQAEEALRTSEEKYRALFDQSVDGIYLHDLEGRILEVNEAALRQLGYTRDELLRQNVLDLLPDALDKPGIVQRWREWRPGERYTVEGMHRGADGSFLPVEVSTGRIRIGGREALLAITRNIADRKRAEEALRESARDLAHAQKVAHTGSWRLEVRTNQLRWSDESYRIFGLPAEQPLTYESFLARVHPDDRPMVDASWQAALRGEPYDLEHRIVVADEVKWVRERAELERDATGAVVGGFGTVQDISESKRLIEALEAANAQLSEVDRLKNEFLAVLSHELRNPLAPISNALYILEHAAPGGEQAHRAHAIIVRQVGQMSRLIDDLLDVTRITHGRIELRRERLDLNALTQRTVEDHRGAFLDAAITLAVAAPAAPVWVLGDRTRLAQVIGNLLHNAAKFTPRGGHTAVSVEVDELAQRARVRVADTGRGIAREALPRLFAAFAQADTTLDREKGGLGLGLALVKSLVEMHGGTVLGESAGVGAGSTFTITLPLATAPAAVEAAPRPGAAAGVRRVLLIEDNEDAATTLREALEMGGHEVRIAATGPEGIAQARAQRPDVVVCDIGLPGMDGYEVARLLRADPELGRLALVALTGYTQPADLEKARAAGFDCHLAKPCDIEALESVVRSLGEP
jgi:PAS domain S-box-containing protein